MSTGNNTAVAKEWKGEATGYLHIKYFKPGMCAAVLIM